MKISPQKINRFSDYFITGLFGSHFFSLSPVRRIRLLAYRKRFNIGEDPTIEQNVYIYSPHGIIGSILIGDRVLLARNVSIDYSGGLVLEDDVWISANAKIITHEHDLNPERLTNKNRVKLFPLIIEYGAWLGTGSIILPQVAKIGRNSIVAAGSIVTKDVPPNVIVGGSPAKTIRSITIE